MSTKLTKAEMSALKLIAQCTYGGGRSAAYLCEDVYMPKSKDLGILRPVKASIGQRLISMGYAEVVPENAWSSMPDVRITEAGKAALGK